jgi:serine/threonine protein kinase
MASSGAGGADAGVRAGAGVAPSGPKLVGEWRLERRLGSGSFASVFLAQHVRYGADKQVAVKAIARGKLNPKLERNLHKEVLIMQGLAHPNIVHLFETHESSKHIYLVMELCQGGDMHVLLRKGGPLGEPTARELMRQLASGMHYLWSRGLIHRDLKPQNLLLSQRGPGAVLKIADFGFATHLGEAAMAETMCGSPLYMAPEVLDGKRYDSKADLWSAGAILYEMLQAKPPFYGASPRELLRNILATRFRWPEGGGRAGAVSRDCQLLLERMLVTNPVERITFEEFYAHSFLARADEAAPLAPVVPPLELLPPPALGGLAGPPRLDAGPQLLEGEEGEEEEEKAQGAPPQAGSPPAQRQRPGPDEEEEDSDLPGSPDSSGVFEAGMGGGEDAAVPGSAAGAPTAPAAAPHSAAAWAPRLSSKRATKNSRTGSGVDGAEDAWEIVQDVAAAEPAAAPGLGGGLGVSGAAARPVSAPAQQRAPPPPQQQQQQQQPPQPQQQQQPPQLQLQPQLRPLQHLQPGKLDTSAGGGGSAQHSSAAQVVRLAGELGRRAVTLGSIAWSLGSASSASDDPVARALDRSRWQEEPAVALALLLKAVSMLDAALDACESAAARLSAAQDKAGAPGGGVAPLLAAARLTRNELADALNEQLARSQALEAQALLKEQRQWQLDAPPLGQREVASAERLMVDLVLSLGAASAGLERVALLGRSHSVMDRVAVLVAKASDVLDLLLVDATIVEADRDKLRGIKAALVQRRWAIKAARAGLQRPPASEQQ